LELPGAARGERVGETAARARLTDGVEVRVRCAPADAFAAAWVHATGSEAHVERLAARAASRGLRLNEYGLWRGEERVAVADEAALYDALGLGYIEPELREGDGEVEAAAGEGELPGLVDLDDLRGCFHCHTTYSDGHATVREMAEAAAERGWRYLGLADHSQAAAYAGGLSPEGIERQHEEIDAWNAERGDELWLFKGIEADILPDGRLDYDDLGDAVLGRFDYVVGSIHSSFGLSEAEQTKRVLRAMENPHLTFLGHPTGRILLSREGYAIDLDAVIEAAAERGVGIEINANPRRLDLDWRRWRRARALGVRTAINPDAHSVDGLDHVRWGVGVARKGWLGPDDVVNAWDLDAVRRHLAEARTG
ncbi:MAG: PHP domain-containing protein, partial [Gemmatimonadota bacterium]